MSQAVVTGVGFRNHWLFYREMDEYNVCGRTAVWRALAVPRRQSQTYRDFRVAFAKFGVGGGAFYQKFVGVYQSVS